MLNKLPDHFIGTGEVKGFEFTKIAESDKGYVYKVDDHYEYFLKKKVSVCLDFGKRLYSDTDFKEIYPKAKDFGIWAWTTHNLNKALCAI
jgi:hypothetical protein